MVEARIAAGKYIVVGDSSSHRFDGLILEHPTGPAVMKARWQPMAQMGDVYRDGKLSEYLTRILMEMRYVKRTQDSHWPFPALPESIDGTGPVCRFEPRFADRCVLLFSFGEVALFQLAHEFAAGDIDERAAEQAVRTRSEPLFSAIRTLSEIGYRHVFLHGITPPTKAEGPWPPYAVRFKLSQIGRRVFESFADEAGIGLISIWDEIFSAEHGRDARYVRDHMHLNAASAVLSARRLCEQLERRGYYEGMSGPPPEYPNTLISSP